MIVALGIGCDGRKTVLSIREEATENAAVVNALLSELLERGLDFSKPRFYILDAARRCMRGCAATPTRRPSSSIGPKKRNVVDHLPEEYKADRQKKLQNA